MCRLKLFRGCRPHAAARPAFAPRPFCRGARRLVDVAQDCIIIEEDCKTKQGITVSAIVEGGDVVKVEYSFGYTLNSAGELKIILHDSHLPYSP